MKKIKVLYQSKQYFDACSFYRAMGPLKAMPELKILHKPQYIWPDLIDIDLVFMLRPSDAPSLEVIKYAKLLGLPVIIDWDDDFINIPLDNRAHGYFNSEVRALSLQCIALADALTVSTEKLKCLFKGYNQNIHVINNAIHPRQMNCFSREPREKVIAWRGSDSHQRDLFSVANEIISAMEQLIEKGYKFHFFGYLPWFIVERFSSEHYVFYREGDPFQFYNNLSLCRPEILIVPLAFNDFNLGKSNIAALEGTLVGAKIVAPKIPEFDFPGVHTYKEEVGSFIEAMNQALNTDVSVDLAWDHIKENYLLEHTNKQRLELFNSMIKK